MQAWLKDGQAYAVHDGISMSNFTAGKGGERTAASLLAKYREMR